MHKPYGLLSQFTPEPNSRWGTLAEVLALRERAKKGISELEGSEEKISELRGLLEAACSRYRTLAKELSARRRQSAKRLEKLVAAELKDLALEKARFRVELSSADGADSSCWRESGLDLAELLFSANPGEEPRPLAKAASGGAESWGPPSPASGDPVTAARAARAGVTNTYITAEGVGTLLVVTDTVNGT